MDADNYKTAKSRSRITVSDIWLSVIRVTLDQDKSYSSGRTPIPEDVALRVNRLSSKLKEGAEELEAKLCDELPECAVSLNPNTLDITIAFPQGKVAVLAMCGVDLLNHAQMYTIDRNGLGAATFLRICPPKWRKEKNGVRWYLWRGDFVESHRGNMQNYWNEPKGSLLREALKRYAPETLSLP